MTVIVEHVEAGSIAEQAGLLCGDRLTSYAGQSLTSPAMLLAMEENSFTREDVELCGVRDEQPWEWHLPPGESGAEARPELPEAVLAEYQRGRSAFQAKEYTQAALEWSRIAPTIREKTARAWLYLRAGQAEIRAENWQTGKSYLTLAIELLTEERDSALLVKAWGLIGWCEMYLNNLEAAQDFYEKARQINEAQERPMWVSGDLNGLGNVAWTRGDLVGAHDHFCRALEMNEQFVPNSIQTGCLLNNLADIAIERSELDTASEYHTRALVIWERLAPDSSYFVTGLNGLGRIAMAKGHLKEARDYYARCLEITQRIAPESLDIARSLNNIADAYLGMGDPLSAQDHLARAVAIWERLIPGSLNLAVVLDNLGQVLSTMGDLDAAQDYHTRALAVCEQTAPACLQAATIRNGLGNVALKRRDLGTAQAYYAQALEIRERHALGSVHVAASLHSLGKVADECGHLTDALDYNLRALAIWEHLAPGSLDNANMLEGLAWIALRQNRVSDAERYFHQAIEFVEQQRAQLPAPDARALLLAQHLRKYAGLVRALLALDDTSTAFHMLERARARSFTEMLAARAVDTSDAPPELLADQQEIDQQRGQTYNKLSRLSGPERDTETVETLHRTLRELERRQQELTTQIRVASPHYAALQYPQSLTLDAAQAALEPGTLLLSYLVDDDQTYLFAVTATDAQAHVLPVGQSALQDQVRAFRQSIDRSRLAHVPIREAALGRSLYAQLIAPVRAEVRRADRLLLCPDGPLHTLPFAALVTNKRGAVRCLGAEKPLHSILSATTYAQARAARLQPRPEPPRPPRLLAFGDPIYSASERKKGLVPTDGELSLLQTRGLSLAPLPHSRAEVEGLSRLFGNDATVYVGAEATKDVVLREGSSADLLHFACHGWFDPSLPLSSGLVLSRPQSGEGTDDGDNGLLQAWEIFKLRLSADLVVLSACQSGLGHEVRGEGLVGLTRAFQYAGARSLLVTLWDVNDASTSAFMQAFYAQIKLGTSKDEALRLSVLALQADPRWNAPCYWAAFVLVGDRN